MFWTKKRSHKLAGLMLTQLDERRCPSTVTILPTDEYSSEQTGEYRADPPQPDKTGWGDPPTELDQVDPPDPDKTGKADPPEPDKTGEADPPGVIVGEGSNTPWGWGDPPSERAAIYMNDGVDDSGEKMGPIFMRQQDGLADPPSERAAIYMNDAGEKMGPAFMNDLFVNGPSGDTIVGDPFVGDPFVGDPFVGDPKR